MLAEGLCNAIIIILGHTNVNLLLKHMIIKLTTKYKIIKKNNTISIFWWILWFTKVYKEIPKKKKIFPSISCITRVSKLRSCHLTPVVIWQMKLLKGTLIVCDTCCMYQFDLNTIFGKQWTWLIFNWNKFKRDIWSNQTSWVRIRPANTLEWAIQLNKTKWFCNSIGLTRRSNLAMQLYNSTKPY